MMRVVSQKKTSGRRTKSKRASPNKTGSQQHKKAQQQKEATASSAVVMTPAKGTRKRNNMASSSSAAAAAAAAVLDLSNHKITEFFPVRRSSRKTSKQIEEEEKDALRDAVATSCNEQFLEIYKDDVKGRGIRARRRFDKGEFVVEYKGEMMEYSAAKVLEDEYSNDEQIGSYMYFFNYNNKKWCVDATKESPWKGRLINHSVLNPNLKTKVVEFDNKHHLILVARRDIETGEELLYDYGDRTAATVSRNPWLLNT